MTKVKAWGVERDPNNANAVILWIDEAQFIPDEVVLKFTIPAPDTHGSTSSKRIPGKLGLKHD